jgi:iron complex outermembrane receptor protein
LDNRPSLNHWLAKLVLLAIQERRHMYRSVLARTFLGVCFLGGSLSLSQQPDAQKITIQPFPNFAQQLVDETLAKHPDLLVLAFHVVIPGDSLNRVVAINTVQHPKFLGRPSDDIDTDTAKTSRTVVQVIPATHRMEVHMPLHDKNGKTIATLVTVYNFKDEEEAPELMRRSQAIRDELAPRITSVDQLLANQ